MLPLNRFRAGRLCQPDKCRGLAGRATIQRKRPTRGPHPPPADVLRLRSDVKGYDAERAENTCVVTTLTASIDQVDPNDVAVAFSDHWTSTPRVSVSSATAPLAITCPTPAVCAFDVVTGTPNSRRVDGSYGRPM